jgi:hypothetical protein
VELVFDCPKCLQRDQAAADGSTALVACRHCGWTRGLEPEAILVDVPQHCLVCGCDDLWRQKDFPPLLGLGFVALGIIISTIFVAYRQPIAALGTLMGLALLDMLLYSLMKDCLVCYRCHARFRNIGPLGEQHQFNLETNERYRQESIRKKLKVES